MFNVCPYCSYHAEANAAGVCPECGKPLHASKEWVADQRSRAARSTFGKVFVAIWGVVLGAVFALLVALNVEPAIAAAVCAYVFVCGVAAFFGSSAYLAVFAGLACVVIIPLGVLASIGFVDGALLWWVGGVITIPAAIGFAVGGLCKRAAMWATKG